MASYASQDVFLREASSAKKIIDDRLATQGRSVLLVNHKTTLEKYPLASVTNLRSTLNHLGSIMDPERYILMLFVTSHGKSKVISVDLPYFSLNDLKASDLRKALDDAKIVNRIIVLSACYSGSIIPELEDKNTLVLTAAHKDRASFGCTNEREWTFFGDALFNHALRKTHSLPKAFEMAKKTIAKWEHDEDLTPSQPQIFIGKNIAAKLRPIVDRLSQRPTANKQQSELELAEEGERLKELAE